MKSAAVGVSYDAVGKWSTNDFIALYPCCELELIVIKLYKSGEHPNDGGKLATITKSSTTIRFAVDFGSRRFFEKGLDSTSSRRSPNENGAAE